MYNTYNPTIFHSKSQILLASSDEISSWTLLKPQYSNPNFSIQTDRLIPARRPDLIIINKKKRICKIVDFTVPAEKKDKYLDLARELKKQWNMKVTIVPIVIGALGTITKGLLKGLEDFEVGGRVETIQTTALLRTTRILRRVLET